MSKNKYDFGTLRCFIGIGLNHVPPCVFWCITDRNDILSDYLIDLKGPKTEGDSESTGASPFVELLDARAELS